jgi:ketosteroid isomerase-like protein
MKKIVILLLLSIVVSCKTQKRDQSGIDAIHKWIADYEQAIKASDIESLLSGVTDDITYYPPNQTAFSGKENLKNWLSEYFNYYDPSELLIVRDIKVDGDIAYLSCYYAVHVRVKSSGEEFRDVGKLINIFKQEFPGRWKCSYSVWNSNNFSFDLHSRIPADFSGSWELIPDQSTHVPGLVSSNMIITQQGDKINIERSYAVQGKDLLKNVLDCTIGSETKSSSKSGPQITKSFWSTDKKSFTITERLVSGGEEYKRTTTYSLIDSGENLRISLFDQVPYGLLDSTGHEQIVMTFKKVNNTK